MKVKAAAKINLMLDVLGKLPNGYHSLYMIMQSVSCYDFVTVNHNNIGKIRIITDDEKVPTDEKNIAYKAAKKFFEYNSIDDWGVDISIEKHIPMAAGLAGGSADGAGVIYILNELYQTGLLLDELCEIGKDVGADIPFSLTGGTALCMNIGEVIAPLPDLTDCYFVLCKPDMDVSTPNAYKQIDESEGLRHTDKIAMLHAMREKNYELMCSKANNVFEQVVEVPKRPYIKAEMKKLGADLALMSGSGPTIYGAFNDYNKAKACEEHFKKNFKEVYLTQPVAKSIEVIEE